MKLKKLFLISKIKIIENYIYNTDPTKLTQQIEENYTL